MSRRRVWGRAGAYKVKYIDDDYEDHVYLNSTKEKVKWKKPPPGQQSSQPSNGQAQEVRAGLPASCPAGLPIALPVTHPCCQCVCLSVYVCVCVPQSRRALERER